MRRQEHPPAAVAKGFSPKDAEPPTPEKYWRAPRLPLVGAILLLNRAQGPPASDDAPVVHGQEPEAEGSVHSHIENGTAHTAAGRLGEDALGAPRLCGGAIVRSPDRHVAGLLPRAGKPRGEEAAGRQLDDGRAVARRGPRVVIKDEVFLDH